MKVLLHNCTMWAPKDPGVNGRVRLYASLHARCIQLDFALALQSNNFLQCTTALIPQQMGNSGIMKSAQTLRQNLL